jgi:small-conductance mechanosensitive channel
LFVELIMINSSSLHHQEDPNAIAKRLMQKAHNQDGLPEIAIGVTLLTVAGLEWLHVGSRAKSLADITSGLGIGLLVPALILGSQWTIKHVRRRYLIEKVGYVEPKPISRKRRGIAFIILAAVAVATVFAVYIFRGSIPSTGWLLAGTGIIGGALAVVAGRLPRFIIGGVIMAATGIYLAFSGVSLTVGFAILYGLMGLLSLVSGCVVLMLFLRQPAEAGE